MEQGQGAINMNPWYRMRVHQLKMIKRPGYIYWSQVDYKSLAWCSCEKGKWNFKMHQEKCFDRSEQPLKPFYKTPCMGKTSSETRHLIPIIHIKKKKKNSHQNKSGGKLQGWPEKQIANVIKEEMGRKLACLAHQNKSGNVAWLFFRSTGLDNPQRGGKKIGDKYWHKNKSL